MCMRIKQVFLGRRGLYRVAYRSFSNLGLNLGHGGESVQVLTSGTPGNSLNTL